MIKLLLVEDDSNLQYLIKSSLEDIIGDYEVYVANNGQEGLKIWKECKPDIIVADIEMPEMDGFAMLEKIRETDVETLVIFASGRVSPKDVTAAFKLGGNNYIKKPFIPQELDAHVRAMVNLRDELRTRNESQIRKIGTYSFDAINGTFKDIEGIPVPVTAREAQLLQMLCINKGEIVKRNSIIEKLWDKEGNDFFASRSLDVFINKLRKKFAKDPAVEIRVVKGVGITLKD